MKSTNKIKESDLILNDSDIKNNDERKEFYSKETFKTILVELRYQNKNIKEIFEEK